MSMQAIIVGTILGVIILAFADRGQSVQAGPGPKPTALDWLVLGLGILTFVLNLVSFWSNTDLFVPSITLAAATVVSGVGAIARRARPWQAWVGLILGGLPALFWIAFGLAHLFWPD
jgi:hypothetical protein